MVDDRCAAGLGETDERTAPPAARKCDSVVALRRCTPERRLQQFRSETSPSQWLDDRDHGGPSPSTRADPDESPADHHAEAGPAPGGQVAERSGWQLGCGRAEEALLAEQLLRERQRPRRRGSGARGRRRAFRPPRVRGRGRIARCRSSHRSVTGAFRPDEQLWRVRSRWGGGNPTVKTPAGRADRAPFDRDDGVMTNTLDSNPPVADPQRPAPPAAPAPPPARPARGRERTPGHIIAIVVGCLLLLPGSACCRRRWPRDRPGGRHRRRRLFPVHDRSHRDRWGRHRHDRRVVRRRRRRRTLGIRLARRRRPPPCRWR